MLQTSASESTLISLLAAREHHTKRLLLENPMLDEYHIRSSLVVYASEEVNVFFKKTLV